MLVKRTALTRKLFFVMADIFLVALSVWLAFFLRFDGQIPQQFFNSIYIMALLAVAFAVPVFYYYRLYSFSWSYVSAPEAIFLFKAASVSFILLSIALLLVYRSYAVIFPRSAVVASYILVFVLCGALRFAKRIRLYTLGQNRAAMGRKTLIIGAGDAGEQILRSILSSSKSQYNPVGFLDDSPFKKDVVIHGIKVLGKISDIVKIARGNEIKQMIIALPSADSKTIRYAVEAGKMAGIRKIKIAPAISEIIRGEVSFKNLKDVDVEDLLGREPVALDTKEIESFIKGKKILISGAAGSIGSELSRQAAKFKPAALLLLDQDETGIFDISNQLKNIFPDVKIVSLVADITDENKIKNIFSRHNPQIVFHAAAYKHVPLMEENADEAVKNNIFGTKILASAAIGHGAEKFIFISTDKAINPTSVMGATKRIGEMVCQAASQLNSTKFVSVRFGNVLNSRGSVIPTFKEQIKRGGPVEVTHPDMKRYFMLTSEACLLVMQAGAMGKGGEVFVLDMGQPVKILDLAKEMIKLSGFEPDRDIAIVFTGIRPGEKLFEEILSSEEGIAATRSEKIFVAKLSGIGHANLEEKLAELASIVSQGQKEKITPILSNLVAGYNK